MSWLMGLSRGNGESTQVDLIHKSGIDTVQYSENLGRPDPIQILLM